jgi:CRP-like cAMP-binding protein
MINNNNYNIFIEDLEEILYDCISDPIINLKQFDFDREKRHDEIYIRDIIQNLFKKLPKLPHALVDKYFSILKDKEHEFYTFKKYTLRKIGELKDGDYLGEETLDSNLERKCTVIALEDTHLSYIDYDLYSDIVKKYNEIIKDKDAKFLKDSFYFKRISLQYFIKNYFSDFSYQELTYGNHIYKQNSSFENIYFLKEGVIEVYCNKSVVEILNLVKLLSQKLKNSSSEEIKSELLSIYNKLYIYGKLNHNFTINTTSRLLIIPNADILGIESWITNMPYFYNCKIISDKAKFFKISLSKINNLFSYLKEGKEQFSEDANNRLELLCRRLIKIINIKIQYFNKFNNYKDTQKKRLIPNIIKKENNNNNNMPLKKKFFSSRKIKDLLFEKSNKEKENEYIKHHKSPFFYLTFTNMGSKRNKKKINDNNYIENDKSDTFAKTLNFNKISIFPKCNEEKQNHFSIKISPYNNRKLLSKLDFTQSEKSLNSQSRQLMPKIEGEEKVVNKKIYTIKGEIKLLNNLKNVLEEELLLSKKALKNKNDKNKYLILNEKDTGTNTIKKAQTFDIHKKTIDSDFNNISLSRKISANTDFDYYNSTIPSYFNIFNSNKEDRIDKTPNKKNSTIKNIKISEPRKKLKLKNNTNNNNINIKEFNENDNYDENKDDNNDGRQKSFSNKNLLDYSTGAS